MVTAEAFLKNFIALFYQKPLQKAIYLLPLCLNREGVIFLPKVVYAFLLKWMAR